jgi:hypothetical protein
MQTELIYFRGETGVEDGLKGLMSPYHFTALSAHEVRLALRLSLRPLRVQRSHVSHLRLGSVPSLPCTAQ